MTKELLDNFEEEKERVKHHRNISKIWLVYSIASLYFGLDLLYNYSSPHMLWTFTVLIHHAYESILIGLGSFIISQKILKNEKGIQEFLLLGVGIIVIFYLSTCFEIESRRTFKEGDFLIELLEPNYIVSIGLIMISLYFFQEKTRFKILFKNTIKLFPLVLLGFIPFLLSRYVPYSSFEFLH